MILDEEIPTHDWVAIRQKEPSCYLFVKILALVIACFEEENGFSCFGKLGC
jgi:hypothetical protein